MPKRRHIPARKTMYRGIEMRSRNEARYAGALDGLGLTWEYEPCAFADGPAQYLPDFRIELGGQFPPLFMEVRPGESAQIRTLLGRMAPIRASVPNAGLGVALTDWGRYFALDMGGFLGLACWGRLYDNDDPEFELYAPVPILFEAEVFEAASLTPNELADRELEAADRAANLMQVDIELIPFDWRWRREDG